MNNTYKKEKRDVYRIVVFLSAFVTAVLLATALAGSVMVKAADSISIKEIDYEKSVMTIQLNADDNALLISDSKQRKWELVPQEPDADNRITLDISWISLTKDYVISLKGDASSEPVKTTIPKQITNFRAVYSTATGTVTFTNTGERTIQWKKKDSMVWETVDTATLKDELYGLCANGALVYFRLAPENGSGNIPGQRASREIQISIAKKSAAPSITVDASKLSIPVTKDMEYRYLDENLNPLPDASWTAIEKTENMPLYRIASKAMAYAGDPLTVLNYQQLNISKEDVYLQFRTIATSSKQVSNTTSIKVPKQEQLSYEVMNGITLTYTSSTTFEIKILAAGTKTPFEYCIINADDVRAGITINDVEEIKWNTISSNSPVVIDKDTADVENGSQVYIRRKTLKELGNDEYSIASPILMLTGSVDYPGDVSSTAGSLTWYQTIAGVCNSGNSDGFITFTMYSPTKNYIKTLKFVDYDNKNVYGTVDISSTVAENPEFINRTETDKNKKYIITTVIKSTAAIDAFAEKKMLAYITFDGKAEFESDSSKGIGLYIYPASKVNNPATDSEKIRIGKLFDNNYDLNNDKVFYSNKFTRVYSSLPETTAANSYYPNFKFKLELGTVKIPDVKSQIPASFNNNEVMVSSLKYDGVTFLAEQVNAEGKPYFTVEYSVDRASDGDDIRIAWVTVNADIIEQCEYIDERDSDAPITIYLNNNEILDKSITMNLANTATIDNGPLSWSLTAGTLKTEDIITTTENGATVSRTQKVVSYTMDLTLFDRTYDVAVLDVLWDNVSVYDTASVSGGKAHIELSNEKINRISVDQSTSKPLIITFSNGYRITTGCKMTILANPAAGN